MSLSLELPDSCNETSSDTLAGKPLLCHQFHPMRPTYSARPPIHNSRLCINKIVWMDSKSSVHDDDRLQEIEIDDDYEPDSDDKFQQ